MLLWCHGRHLSGRKHTMHIHTDTQTKLRKGCCLMTSNWKTVRNTLVWLIVAMITMGIVTKPTVAAIAPGIPFLRLPIKVETFRAIRPGVHCPMAK